MNKYALISVSDKTGIEILAMGLENLGYTILSTSRTAKHLRQFCNSLVEVSDYTGFPEILDGRVKTLHPKIHGAILADRNKESHLRSLKEHDIGQIDIVVVNLYPFAEVRMEENSSHEQIIENIDIGGPSLIRAAAKNYRNVTVLCDYRDYEPTLEHLKQDSQIPECWSSYLAQKAFAMVSNYDAVIADYLEDFRSETVPEESMPPFIDISANKHQSLRYGENPHQKAAFYTCHPDGWNVLHGKELSFNNIMDIDASLKAIRLFKDPTVIIIKHCNPCGIGSGSNLSEAYRNAFATDTVAPYGGIVVVNRRLDLETAVMINRIFTEIIIAPGYEKGVLDVLMKKKSRRLISYEPSFLIKASNRYEIKTMQWGYLAQEWDLVAEDIGSWKVVTQRQPSSEEFDAMVYGWKAVALLKSNAIALAYPNQIVGFGIGQTSRIDSTSIAIWKANKFKHELSKAVCASDGFFPYRDSIDELYQAGVKAVIQPGGSKGDEECIQACDELDMTMVFTGYRHFRH
ncbi:MAG: bifunctional phosphoribosylaminoimidazolecarboxamide formyltransferase/IMP cyclohydrolase [Candidatus Cloacimonetes bacterium]|nr:bifunctional phosphoribosylaminoimidazolecarboxamide formyltransferase/IMP cyclohydrolase [Candidatus Cloacimonadota bacterium]MDD2506123.1 bifunctional phosphoribosylaminoimidazolecarboxamide formyltransferase/IMP cyclohydrolase [Candidatus Cloacimonadota bacterium]MDD4147883.1 bifunctional phosphoribosylaminoimidazolecarboxamide formyltransferase/IMP cyclohydrolase [Candidatus Cloacimonadota bacterium]MDD4559728.1 bifunctional phosphoribosylaminoimidazolecarboxamide formyltransferase/IMP cy